MNKAQHKKCLEFGNKREFVLVIIVKNKTKALKFCIKSLKFRRALEIVEKY